MCCNKPSMLTRHLRPGARPQIADNHPAQACPKPRLAISMTSSQLFGQTTVQKVPCVQKSKHVNCRTFLEAMQPATAEAVGPGFGRLGQVLLFYSMHLSST